MQWCLTCVCLLLPLTGCARLMSHTSSLPAATSCTKRTHIHPLFCYLWVCYLLPVLTSINIGCVFWMDELGCTFSYLPYATQTTTTCRGLNKCMERCKHVLDARLKDHPVSMNDRSLPKHLLTYMQKCKLNLVVLSHPTISWKHHRRCGQKCDAIPCNRVT